MPAEVSKPQSVPASTRRGSPTAALQFPLDTRRSRPIIPGAISTAEVEQNLAYPPTATPADLGAELKAKGAAPPGAGADLTRHSPGSGTAAPAIDPH